MSVSHPSLKPDSRETGMPRAPVPANRRSLIVVLPAYNEEEGLERLLERLHQTLETMPWRFSVVVVDDASTDGTAQVARAAANWMPVMLVSHPENRGLAGAIESGLTRALEMADLHDIVISMDADDTHAPGLIPRMVQRIDEGHDVVIASRYQPGSRTLGVPGYRLILTWGARWLFKILTPIPGVRDYTCGYRAYRATALREAMHYHGDKFFTESGFSCMADILLKMRPLHPVMGEVPMILRYDRKPGLSKMRVGRTIGQTLYLLLKRRLGRFD